MIRVDLERCTGCGICVDSCHTKAIQIVDAHAAIDDGLCDHCEACIRACPEGALSSMSVVVPASRAQPPLLPALVPLRDTAAIRPSNTTWQRRVLPILGAAISFAVREIVPRVVDALVSAPVASKYNLGAPRSIARGIPEGGQRLRRRRRGGWPGSG